MTDDPESSLSAARAWVADHLSRGWQPGPRGIEDIAQVARHPERPVVACSVMVRLHPHARSRRRVALVDLVDGAAEVLELPYDECSVPVWSPDGRHLALVGSTEATAVALVLDAGGAVEATSEVPGLVETCAWSPDSTRVALQVAEPGAEISDVFGSGVVGGGDAPTWTPLVQPHTGGRRRAWVWTPSDGCVRAVGGPNVWELTWAGDAALLAVTSEGVDENAWYGATLTRLPLDGSPEPLLAPEHQLALPRSSPDGSRWSVLCGVQSDRSLPSGTLVVDGKPVDTGDVYASDHRWLDASTLLVAGLRGLDTVVATLTEAGMRELWSGDATCGEYQPEVSGVPGHPPLLVLEEPARPPTLGELTPGGFRPVLAVRGPGASYQGAHAGTTSRLCWISTDGLSIEGLLTVPHEGAAPYPLVLHVHGGPTHAWRGTWSGRDPFTALLVARGYAVLRPNPRGSTGRGAAFAEGVYGDMGGLDAQDVLAGVRHLVETGVADRARIGVTGISYGGFFSALLPGLSDLFAASFSRSPVTDWRLFHLTSNIAEFDRRFLGGDPFDPASRYAMHSPMRHHAAIETPMLLTAGLRDLATPASQAQVMHAALAERGVPAALVLYPEEGHGVRAQDPLIDVLSRMVDWFERFMPVRRD